MQRNRVPRCGTGSLESSLGAVLAMEKMWMLLVEEHKQWDALRDGGENVV